MARGRLEGVAAAVLSSFLSRNNDIDGYWALGLLRSFADATDVSELRLDVLNGNADPIDTLTLRVAQAYQAVLQRQLLLRGIPADRIARAEVVVSFDVEDAGIIPYTLPYASYGEPFRCIVSLTDSRSGREHRRSTVARCAPHDPRRESRSTRFKAESGS